jgi:tight adherence protein C
MTIAIVFFCGAGIVLVWTFSASGAKAAAGEESGASNLHEQALERPAVERLISPFLMRLGAALNKVMPAGRLTHLRQRILLAGKQATWNVAKVMALKALGTIVGTIAGVLLLTTGVALMTIVGAILCVGIGFFAVDYYLDHTASARQVEIQHTLPDMLDQITVCVEAGLGFDAALHRVASTNENILADELNRTLQDIRIGVARSQALHSLLDRTDVQDLRLFVRALIQAERSGIPIARVLLVQSDEVREKRRQAAEERAMKLPVMLVLPLVLCILPSLFTVIMGPAVLRMIREGAV